AAGGEIFNQCVAERDEAFKEEDVKRLLRQILEGVSFLHRNNVPQNILLTSDAPLGDIKIVDFGLSRMVSSSQELREIMGTPDNRATAEECLQHQWLQAKEKREAEATVEVKGTISPTKCTSDPASPESPIRGEEEEGPETEELIVVAAYALGHCRQSTDKEVMNPDQKAISKRFKFEEPFSALQEVPGEFIY
ncbi:unnamed protein product, partial [Coregonus sp. 'balchen']